jgi:hypothetical protein
MFYVLASLYGKLKERTVRVRARLGFPLAWQPACRGRVQFPLIVAEGPRVNLSNERIYEHVEFP